GRLEQLVDRGVALGGHGFRSQGERRQRLPANLRPTQAVTGPKGLEEVTRVDEERHCDVLEAAAGGENGLCQAGNGLRIRELARLLVERSVRLVKNSQRPRPSGKIRLEQARHAPIPPPVKRP